MPDTGSANAGMQRAGLDQNDGVGQDIELIRQMLKEYLGNENPSDADIEEGRGHLSDARGMMAEKEKQDEVMKCAGYSMKMAKHKAAKVKESDADKKGKGETMPADKKDQGTKQDTVHAEAGKKVDAPTEDAALKEANAKLGTLEAELKEAKANVDRLNGENAALKAAAKEGAVEKHIDKILKESGLPNSATKLFREKLGKVKTEEEVTERFEMFKESWNAARKEQDAGYILSTEKVTDQPNQSLSASDMLRQ